MAHEKLTHPRLGELLDEALADASAADEHRAMCREAKRDRDRAVKVPGSLVREISDTSGKAYVLWAEAKSKKRFDIFSAQLAKLVELKKQEAAAVGFPSGGVAYDALLDTYEPGATVAKLDPILSETRDLVTRAAAAIRGSKRKPKQGIVYRKYPVAGQEKLAGIILETMGFDTAAGRLDRTIHPFCSSFDIDDVRITTKYDERSVADSLYSIMHEAGHGLYEQGLPRAYNGTVIAEPRSLGIHESQSRLWENQIGRSRAFLKFLFPKLRQIFPSALKGVKLEDFYFAINAVTPSFIRIEADEVTYNLHVIIRYEIEKALFSGQLRTEDLPAAFNEKMKQYLGITPPDVSKGALQDIHWSMGMFGYFPTYLLGNLYSAQFMAVMRESIRGFDGLLSKGNTKPIKTWLNSHVHVHGRRYPTDELCRRATGQDLNPAYFAEYLRDKFGELYDVSW